MEAPNTLYPDAVSRSSESREVGLQYVEFDHGTLIDMFYETEGDPLIGRELSVRLLGHIDFRDDPLTTPLVGRNGTQVNDDGTLLTLADYVNFAAKHHFDAIDEILDTLLMKRGTPEYEEMKEAMLNRLKPTKS